MSDEIPPGGHSLCFIVFLQFMLERPFWALLEIWENDINLGPGFNAMAGKLAAFQSLHPWGKKVVSFNVPVAIQYFKPTH